MAESYSIVRFYQRDNLDSVVLETGLTLDEAQAHCQDKETSSTTAKRPEAIEHTRTHGAWFDGYRSEGPTRRPGFLEQSVQAFNHSRR